ncbi:uncharacterized protein LOC128673692 [Plodia interpunctella]|uniref:uncharacterized protein LOC128673692 n=1 Tax=Plodia interpunctella TaxID=58824 RepID=UPI0023686321|nr:uncharacterized protein LOC128673692 [Plodia interpunctella]
MMTLKKILSVLCLLTIVKAELLRTTEQQKQELAEYIKKKKAEINPRFRLHYHVMPPVGWMNDPNGFSYYKGEFHIFYQFYPYDSKWGPMHWGHSSGPDLVTWNEQPTALLPDEEQIFSGSAVTVDNTLVLMYTGHKITTDSAYNESQYLAYSKDGVNFTKYERNPVITLNTSPDFRDPKMWKYGDYWYVVLGTKTSDQQHGRVVLYRSSDLTSWEYLSVIGESNGTMGYMWECPDFFELNGKFVLLMSPQGMKAQGDRYKNTFQTGYILGNFSYETNEFIPETEFVEIDYGHDFYATQTIDHDGKRYLIAWFGMWEVPHPEDVDGWTGAMTIVRELKLVGDRVLMQPLSAMEGLRDSTVLIGYFNKSQVLEFDSTAEIILEGDMNLKIELLLEGRNNNSHYNQTRVSYNPADGKVAVKRGNDDVRQAEWIPIGSKKIRLFLDASALELFCGEGEVVFSSRLYVDGPWKVTNVIAVCLFTIVNANLVRQSEEAKLELAEYILNKKAEINPRYRLEYHVMPPVGWMNDPNGFSYYKGEFHIFFQYYPYDSVWGPMYWGHYSGPDLVNWNELPTALIPEEEMCFSGSAIVHEESLVLMYTGRINIDPKEDTYNESQYLALSDDGVNFYKYVGNPVLALPSGGSPDFRDPKVWKHGDHYYVIIGTKTDNLQFGKVVLYRSSDLLDWEFLSVIGESNGDMGYMWECPDFFELDGKFVLLMSPQGLEPQGDRYRNIYQVGYYIGSFDYETFQFVPEVAFQELDFGHDFYASQTLGQDGKRYVLAWFSAWEKEHPEAVDGWDGALTLVRELKIVDNRILQIPVESMLNLRGESILNGDFNEGDILLSDNTAEIIIEGDLEQNIELLLEGRSGGDPVWIRWDPEVGKVAVDRGSDDIRQVEWSPIGSKSWRLFLDTSSLELFCGEGEVVFSSRVYVDEPWKVTNLSPQPLKVESWRLKRSVPEP